MKRGDMRIGPGFSTNFLILMGLAMTSGKLTAFALWLLNTFPGFASVG